MDPRAEACLGIGRDGPVEVAQPQIAKGGDEGGRIFPGDEKRDFGSGLNVIAKGVTGDAKEGGIGRGEKGGEGAKDFGGGETKIEEEGGGPFGAVDAGEGEDLFLDFGIAGEFFQGEASAGELPGGFFSGGIEVVGLLLEKEAGGFGSNILT